MLPWAVVSNSVSSSKSNPGIPFSQRPAFWWSLFALGTALILTLAPYANSIQKAIRGQLGGEALRWGTLAVVAVAASAAVGWARRHSRIEPWRVVWTLAVAAPGTARDGRRGLGGKRRAVSIWWTYPGDVPRYSATAVWPISHGSFAGASGMAQPFLFRTQFYFAHDQPLSLLGRGPSIFRGNRLEVFVDGTVNKECGPWRRFWFRVLYHIAHM